MAFQVSPGVQVKEKDLTTIVPAVSSTIGGFAGYFQWGPADEIVTVDSENELVNLFGEPTDDNYKHFFTAANFLGYGNNLKVVRIVHGDAKNAGVSAAGTVSKPSVSSMAAGSFVSGEAGDKWYAKYPGQMGNSLKVIWHDGGYSGGVSAGHYDNWQHSERFGMNMPNTTSWAEDLTGSTTVYDALNLVVIDEDGEFSGTRGTVLEQFEGMSKAKNARKFDGDSNYYKDVINTSSKYINWGEHPEAYIGITGVSQNAITGGHPWGGGLSSGTSYTFGVLHHGGVGTAAVSTGGSDQSLSGGTGSFGGAVATTGTTSGYALFADKETVDVSLMLAGPHGSTVAGGIIDIADDRKDCVVFVSPDEQDVVSSGIPVAEATAETNILAFRNTKLNKNSSYAFLDSGWKKMYDRYNDKFRWTPLNADTAGLAVRSDEQTETWFSPAGFNRGQVRGAIKLAFNPRKAHRDNLYQKQVNPVVAFPGEGTVLFGDKTMQTKPSAFDRLNVRRLFIVLEKAIATASKYQLFEQNDGFTRANFKAMVEPFLRDVQARRGITDFKVVCDESNNPGSVIDRNEFVADIYVKPTRSINYITLNFIATKTGVDFTEVGA